MPAMDADQRKKAEDALMRKAEDLVRRMRREAEAGAPDRVDAQAASMAELLKAREFPSVRAAEFRETAKAVQRGAYQRSVDALLCQAERCGHKGDDKGRNEWLSKAKDHFGKAIRLGTDDEFRHGVERRVQAALLTSKDGVDDRTKQANARKLEQHDVGAKPPNGVERRRAIRYADPVLTVTIGDRRFTTANWSIRGALLEPYDGDPDLAVGDRLRLEIACAEIANIQSVHRQAAHVVRIDPERRAFAVDFPAISTAVLDLVHAMREAGIRPEPER